MKLISTNPGKNYEILGRVDISAKSEIKNSVKQANKAKEDWASWGIKRRAIILQKLYKDFSQRKEELALLETQEMGMPITQSLLDIDSGLDYFKWYLENTEKYLAPETTHEDKISIHKVYYEPIGTAAVIVPWNFPFSNVIWGVIPNLLVGNTVVLKHSEECPLFGKLIEEMVTKIKLPQGVFSEVYGGGEVGDWLAHQDIDLIWFTGSTKTGKYLYRVAAEKFIKAVLELGGSAPGIIFEDADVDEILETIYSNKFCNSGQVCDGLKRLIVHEGRMSEVINKLKKLIESKKVGLPEDKLTDIGPLVAERQLKLLKAQVDDALTKGAEVVTGGGSPEKLKGAYYLPTILTKIKTNMRVWQEEVFGPVLPVVGFKNEEEAIKLANDTRYGLGGYVFTSDTKKAQRVAVKIKTGMVSINNVYYLLPSNPFGGYKESGMGREHGKFGIRELCQIKVISSEK